MEIKSSSFNNNAFIPSKHAYRPSNFSPPLSWSGVPKDTMSFVLICDDPDAPVGTWVHWVIFNIPKEKTVLEENVPHDGKLTDGSIQGKSDFGSLGYGGPYPPPGKPHRYFFKLYAIDIMLDLKEGVLKEDVLKAISGHVLAEAEIVGLYKR
ncbi:MAG: YbhB/YbcL family Raf kinase inhibitor-like protein [Candidatus Aureabacteria bacterium]|nr:YbhB/YbcL family Raf kinase inhibitor-like protein [Candidatus Auribacterota bacterium]